MSECIVACGRTATTNAHWPEAVGNRKRKRHPELPTLPLCTECHTRQHAGHPPTIEALIANAPPYWKSQGTWEQARPYYERYLARREYLEAVSG